MHPESFEKKTFGRFLVLRSVWGTSGLLPPPSPALHTLHSPLSTLCPPKYARKRRTQKWEPQSSPKIRTRKPLRKALKNNHFEAFWSSGASGAFLGCSRHPLQSGPERGTTVAGSLDTFSPLSRPPPGNPYGKLWKAVILKLSGALERLGQFWAAPATLSRVVQRGNTVAGSSTTWPNPS